MDFVQDDEYLAHINLSQIKRLQKKEIKDTHFEFGSIGYSVYRRFIELLSGTTLHFFRKTSVKNYCTCLNIRGIEIGNLRHCSDYESGISIRNGKVGINFGSIPDKWIKFLVVTDVLSGSVLPESFDFVKKYADLYLYLTFPESPCTLPEDHVLRNIKILIHPELEDVDITFPTLCFQNFSSVLDAFDVCEKLYDFCILINSGEEDGASMKKFIKQMELFFKRHEDSLGNCWFVYCGFHFKILGNTLCYKCSAGVFHENYDLDKMFP